MKTFLISLRALLALTLLTGVLYPLGVTLGGRLLFPEKAAGSLVEREGRVVGSALIAQPFSSPKYFWPRPSAVKYDATSSGATNLALTSADLVKAVREREAQGAVEDLRYSSGSGLDPHISPTAARSQVKRVAQARQLGSEESEELTSLVETQIEGRQFALFGEERVNVLLLNEALDKRFGR